MRESAGPAEAEDGAAADRDGAGVNDGVPRRLQLSFLLALARLVHHWVEVHLLSLHQKHLNLI